MGKLKANPSLVGTARTMPSDSFSLVPIQKWLFSPISLLGKNFNPRNINHMPAVKIFARLEIDENISFLDGHSLANSLSRFSCAFIEYKGKLRQLFTKGYQPFVQEIVAAKMNFTGESTEIYHAWIEPNSPENRIEIQFGVT